MDRLHSENLKDYIFFLENITTLINDNIDIVIKSPSIDYKKHYLRQLNSFNLVINDNKIELLTKSFECKKNLLIISEMGKNLLNDIIKYCNKYGLKEVEYFDYVEKISTMSIINENEILKSIEFKKDLIKITTEDYIRINNLFSFYFEINNIKIDIKRHKNRFIQDNIYINLKSFTKKFNKKKYNELI